MLTLFVLLAGGCARQTPTAELVDSRRIIDHAYASGAARFAPGEYQLAHNSLIAAEQMIASGDYEQAEAMLEKTRLYSSQALAMTLQQKKQQALQQQEKAEQQRDRDLLAEQQRTQEQTQRKLERQRKQQETVARTPEKKSTHDKKLVSGNTDSSAGQAPAPERTLLAEVEVRPGETLAQIAAREEIYADPLLWPLIYRANRDQIKNPQEIFAGQKLVVPRQKTSQEQTQARAEARSLGYFNLF